MKKNIMRLFFTGYSRKLFAVVVGLGLACAFTHCVYAIDAMVLEESNAHYVRGVDSATMARFDEAESEFKKAVEINDLNYDAREGLRIIGSIGDGKISKDLALSIFSSKKIGFQLEKLEAKIKAIGDQCVALKRQIDLITSDRTGKNRDMESRISDLDFKIERLQNDLDSVKRRTNLF